VGGHAQVSDPELPEWYGRDHKELLGRVYFNGLVRFRVIELDRANPTTHVVVESLGPLACRWTISARLVREHREVTEGN
jgi:hypothetical protein